MAHTQLVFTPNPISGESVSSYRMRLAIANRYPSVSWINAAKDGPKWVKRCTRSDKDNLDDLAALTGYPVAELSRTLVGTNQLASRFLNLSIPRICPACLSETGYAPWLWEITLLVACPIHGCYLIDSCPCCGTQLTWNEPTLLGCRCSVDIRNSPRRIASDCITVLSIIIARASLKNHALPLEKFIQLSMPQELLALELPELMLALQYLGGLAHYKQLPKIMKAATRRVARAEKVVGGAGQCLSNWPSNYHKVLTRLLKIRGTSCDMGVQKAFGRPYHYLYKILTAASFGFIREGFESYLQSNWNTLLDRRYHWFTDKTLASGRYVSSLAASRMLKKSWTRVLALVKSGKLPGVIKVYPSGRPLVLIERQALREYAGTRDKIISIKAAAKYLGIPDTRVRELFESGKIKIFGKPGHVYGRVWQLVRNDVESIAKDLLLHSPRDMRKPTSKKLITVHGCLRYYLSDRGDWPDFLVAVRNGRIKIHGRLTGLPGISGLTVSVTDLRNFLQTQSGIDRLRTSLECEEVLGLTDVVIRRLMRLRLLGYRVIRRGHRKIRFVSPAHISKFRERFITAKEIASRYDTSSRHVRGVLKAKRVRPIPGTKDTNGGINIYRKKQAINAYKAYLARSQRLNEGA